MIFTIAFALPILAFPFLTNARPSGREGPSALEHRDHGGESYRKRDVLSDIDILNFALTLEHLENKFYDEGLARYSQQDFLDAGYPEWTRGRYEQIAAHEKTHVEFLSSAITAAGAKAVEPCKYRFHDKDVNTFIDISFALESVGTSAYNGAAAFITDKAYLTVAASILGVEARQAAWINSAVRKSNPWNTAFETPLDMNQVYTLASAFIKSCPESNPPLPVKAFPTLTVPPTAEGEHAKLEFEAHEDHTQLYAAFLSGTGTVFVEINDKNEVLIPEGLLGLVFVLVTSDGGKVADESTVAGPTMLQFSFGSNGNVY
ncbi:ferritin-like domain-containing protein [Lyophyllum atratum]|nr:ferritin-like domain-containing protein [Lyophyllum atratum]